MEGVKLIMDELPNQDETAKAKYRDLFEGFLGDRSKAAAAIQFATPEQCARHNDVEIDDEKTEIDSDGTALVPRSMLYDVRLQSYMKQTEAQLTMERERTAMEKERTAIEKERTEMERTKAAKEMAEFKLKAEQEAFNLKLQLKDADHRADKAQWEVSTARVREVHRRESTAGIELDADEEERDSAIKKVHNPVTKKNHPPVTKEKPKRWAPDGRSHFPKVCSTLWVNECPGVNLFPSDPIDTEPEVEESAPPRMLNGSDLIVLMANGIAEEANPASIMGIFYKGNPPSKRTLFDVSHIILEAYGVEADGFQYLCLVLYKNKARPMKYIASILYDYHILPRSITPEFIQGTGPDGAIIPMRHISIYKESQPTDDPVLAMLKKPSSKKWKWNANSK